MTTQQMTAALKTAKATCYTVEQFNFVLSTLIAALEAEKQKV